MADFDYRFDDSRVSTTTFAPVCNGVWMFFDYGSFLGFGFIAIAIILAACILKCGSNKRVVLNYSNNRHIV